MGKIFRDVGILALGMLIMYVIITGINLTLRVKKIELYEPRISNLETFRNNLIASIQQNQQRQPIRQPIKSPIEEKKK